ncbi:hypothetical protein PLESTM_001747300 [Pleodorina starrii]|nr:hypothetical protein PLESTM_001747300 [Pleodorina starrii]
MDGWWRRCEMLLRWCNGGCKARSSGGGGEGEGEGEGEGDGGGGEGGGNGGDGGGGGGDGTVFPGCAVCSAGCRLREGFRRGWAPVAAAAGGGGTAKWSGGANARMLTWRRSRRGRTSPRPVLPPSLPTSRPPSCFNRSVCIAAFAA